MFWSLYDQQGSKWVLQAEQLNGEVSFFKWSYTLRADQFQVFNPLMIVAMIPLFDYFIYPVFNKLNFCTKPLQKVSVQMMNVNNLKKLKPIGLINFN